MPIRMYSPTSINTWPTYEPATAGSSTRTSNASPAQTMRSRRWSRTAMRAARRRRMEPSTSLRDRDDNEDGDCALRAEALPGVEEVAEFADEPSYCCSMSWISSWNTPAISTAIAPGTIARRTTAELTRKAAPEQAGDGAAADQDADTRCRAQAERQHVEQGRRQRDEDRLQRHDRHHARPARRSARRRRRRRCSPSSGPSRHRDRRRRRSAAAPPARASACRR